MKTFFSDEQFAYDGSQLHSLFAYMKWGLLGDSIVSWIGPCNVTSDHMVDGEDLRAGEKIQGNQMLHFIIEIFDRDLTTAVSVQRLMASKIKDLIECETQHRIERKGDDLYWKAGKLSISIAARSPVSCMIHFAMNITNDGTPVKTCALNDLQIKPRPLAETIIKEFSDEYQDILIATRKVKPLN